MKITVTKINEVWMKVEPDEQALVYELADKYSFFIANYRHNPKVRAGIWDGKIRLYHIGKKRLYCGLLEDLKEYCRDKDYEIEINGDFGQNELSVVEVKEFLKDLNLPMDPYDYQIKAFIKGVRNKRHTFLSPTSSGKSLIIYMICQFLNVKTLILVPNKTLVNQMSSDFEDYGFEEDIHKIMGGVEKETYVRISISTWQSLYKQDRNWWDEQEFECVIVDEAHGAAADSFIKILENVDKVPYRFGFTGTLDDSKPNPMVIQGLLGPIFKTISTKEMMDRGIAAKLKIKAIVLKHPDPKSLKGMDYTTEIDYICANTSRNRFIKNLINSLEGNTMVLFRYVEKHGRIIEDILRNNSDKPIYWISGATDTDAREEIRKIVDKENNAVLLGTEKAIGTGTSIRNINNLVFISPSKAKIQTLQNIGRALRKSDIKSTATLYDIADDFVHGKKENYTYQHFKARLQMYDEQEFSYKLYEVDLK